MQIAQTTHDTAHNKIDKSLSEPLICAVIALDTIHRGKMLKNSEGVR